MMRLNLNKKEELMTKKPLEDFALSVLIANISLATILFIVAYIISLI